MELSIWLLLVSVLLLVDAIPNPSSPDDGRVHHAPMKMAKEETSSSVQPEVSVTTISTISGTAQVLPPPSTQVPETTGSILTAIDTAGQHTETPLLSTSIPKPETLVAATGTPTAVPTPQQLMAVSPNIFQPIATDAPPSQFSRRGDHPVRKLGVQAQNSPVSTNKFYANFFLGSQSAPTWTHPYSVAWSKGGGVTKSWGMTIQHIDDNQKVFGPDPTANPTQYFINPIGIQSIVLSALELSNSTALTTDSLTEFSAHVNLHPFPGAAPMLQFPLVQGMGFVTVGYKGGTPIIESGVLFRSITKSSISPKPGVTKYIIILEDGKTWLLYAFGQPLELTVVNNGLIQGNFFIGVIQIAKDPGGAESLYDLSCGTWATGVTLSGTASGTAGSYTFSFSKDGFFASPLLMFALPHHVASFADSTRSALLNLRLATTTKGIAQAVLADSWTMQESLPISMGFAPWDIDRGELKDLSVEAIRILHSIAATEISQNISKQTDLNSMYYSGKALAKFAQITYILNTLLHDPALAQTSLTTLQRAFSKFTTNTQQFPLVYDTSWGGLVSSASYAGDPGADFGNTYYNDHHFHYGYFIYAASLIGHLDPVWAVANKPWVDALARDIANASPDDPWFPHYRNFDWYHGHSFAHGLYETFDGRDQESSSEDAMSAYALKLWGSVTGDANLEARGNLQLAVTARALQSYFLYESGNTIQPPNFVGNKVSGILFENKIDHTTYFGANTEYIQGIHMLPLLPCSSLTRTKRFVREEWTRYFDGGRAQKVEGGWRGVLMANFMGVDALGSWRFFVDPDFDEGGLDGGASRSWYAAMAGVLAGV
ncbi:glycosyl hydrolase family 81 [Glarea lozoyensis ATCC 20868]|uniref:glucan endo-1,3-beta-D-glucosidase n=1 Tax=Glarea lozoyensis (strain ATCC 20868 / MF5171) TaxID=1116229 RepID=S3DKH3_GLAL2|nr:glycosyl hydrolase family 81 [Glarea lozoyensis ATCC 20868]EPE27063.1 glycosyl hydrolase family 81 [Glarea lozoyensis ATCC 20868]